MPFGGFNYMGKKAEVITEGKKGILVNPDFIFIKELCEYPSVLSQQPMNISHKVV
jgi:hypothetical protein